MEVFNTTTLRKFVLGDIHGAFRALLQCLERSRFNLSKDLLIFLGDVCDRGPETVACIDQLLKTDHLIALVGNHDLWAKDWLAGNTYAEEVWFQNGGHATYESYTKNSNFKEIRERHLIEYYSKLLPYYKDDANRVFVHAGFDLDSSIEQTTDPDKYFWDRQLFKSAIHYHPMKKTFPEGDPYSEIYIGHSPTHRLAPHFDGSKPIKFCNVWCMDQGAGWGHKLSMMNIETKEVFQSDKVDQLYS